MRLVDGRLRTLIGYDTIVSRHVDEIQIQDIVDIEVLAPYSSPAPKVSLLLIGIAFGLLVGSQLPNGTAMVTAIMVAAFGLVAGVIGRSTRTSQKIIRLAMADGTTYILSYQVEDEPEVRKLLGQEVWRDSNNPRYETPLRPEEEELAERMRYGALLSIGSLAIIAMMSAISYHTDLSYVVTIPVNILFLGVLGFTILFCLTAGLKMNRIALWKRKGESRIGRP